MDSLIHTLKQKSTYDRTLLVYSSIILILPPVLLVINAPYGRFASSNKIFGFGFNKRWSKLAWFMMELMSPIAYSLTIYGVAGPLTWFQLGVSALWYIHYTNRTFIYSYRVPSMAPMALITCLSAIGFNCVNGYTNAYWVATHTQGGWVVLGTCLWLVGFASNIYHDSILFKLRKASSAGYSIPMGGLYRYVSCPNYFSECVEWIGFALVCNSAPSFWFALGTMANLIPRAYKSHQWYQDHFSDYPANRKAVIPFLF